MYLAAFAPVTGAGAIDAVSPHATTVVELETSHSPFLSAPDDLAATIELVHQKAVSVH